MKLNPRKCAFGVNITQISTIHIMNLGSEANPKKVKHTKYRARDIERCLTTNRNTHSVS